MTDLTGVVFNIQRYVLHDGPGIRTTVFLKGCPLACPWCHNPEGRTFEPETLERRIQEPGEAERIVPETAGRQMTVSEVLREVERDTLFFDESGGGVTFSGGEPLARPGFLSALLRGCREREIHAAVDTSGYAPNEVLAEIAPLASLFLFDLKAVDPELHRRLTGVGNRRILENLRTLDRMRRLAMIRFPLIPGFTDAPGNMEAIADFVSQLESIRKVAVLPFHPTARGKLGRMNAPDPMASLLTGPMTGIDPPPESVVKRAANFFRDRGLSVQIGG
jgi:pyruvate formate lyase activating enzyme